MDHKITPKKKGRFNGCIIALLLLIIIALVGVSVVYYYYQRQQLTVAKQLATSMETTTTKIKEGTLELKLENITGTVRSRQSVNLYWQTSGTVADVYVNVGDSVNKDDILMELDELTLDQDILNASLDLEDAEDEMDDLVNNSDAVSNALADLVNAQQAVKDAQDSLASMDTAAYATDINIDLAEQAYLKAQNDYDQHLILFEELRDAPADDEWRIKRLGDVGGYRSVRDNALAQYHWYLGEVDEIEKQTREANLIFAQADYEDKLHTYEDLKKGATTAELSVAQAAIDAAQKKVDASKIIAPFNGTVTRVDTRINDVINYDSSTAARNISAVRIDDISAFYIDVSVSELYINSLEEGLPVTITFAAIPDKVYHGVISNLSDVGVTSGWSVNFDVTVQMTDADEQIKSGMTADITMDIAKAENALYVPQTSIIVNDGKYSVNYKDSAGDFSEVAVTVGLISGSSVQIFSDDLAADDEIQLDVNDEEEEMFGFFPGMMMGGGGMPGGGMPGGGPR